MPRDHELRLISTPCPNNVYTKAIICSVSYSLAGNWLQSFAHSKPPHFFPAGYRILCLWYPCSRGHGIGIMLRMKILNVLRVDFETRLPEGEDLFLPFVLLLGVLAQGSYSLQAMWP